MLFLPQNSLKDSVLLVGPGIKSHLKIVSEIVQNYAWNNMI
jgi:hypothetical protein